MAKVKAKKSAKDAVPSSRQRHVLLWLLLESRGFVVVLLCCILGAFIGFGVGSGYLTGQFNVPPNTWRMTLGVRLRNTLTFQVLSGDIKLSELLIGEGGPFAEEDTSATVSSTRKGSKNNRAMVTVDSQILRKDPSHPNVYAVLREAVVREAGGFVHPDLGILQPAPSGAARGLGMLQNSWHQCQISCFPGFKDEKLQLQRNETTTERTPKYTQEDVLIKVPLKFQMTRSVALQTLLPLIPVEVHQRKANIHELDDAALLVLLLAHERGVGKYSRWLPYIASLPLEPSCGYSKRLEPYMMDSIHALQEEIGLDVMGWPSELEKSGQYADNIAASLAHDYGSFLEHPNGVSAVDNIQWALCQVASRAIAGSQAFGSLRLVPLMDIINHDANAGGYVELTGNERLEENDFLDATEADSGTFVVRSLRYGRRKALKVGQELLVNYNVPHYSAFDWFVSLGFVPPERWVPWQKMDAGLPRVRRDLLFGTAGSGSRRREEDP